MEATSTMREVTEHRPGSFCWIELGTSDAEGAKKFYRQLFGWGINDVPMESEGFYTLLQIDGKDIAGLYQLQEQQRAQGIPPHWLLYISVVSADESAKAAASLGGKVLMEPFDVFDIGRMAIAQDPTGATFALWQPKKHIGSRLVNQPNTFCWGELATNDVDAASAFYTQLLGWSAELHQLEPVKYIIVKNGDQQIGGMLAMTAEWGDIPPHWMIYFAVEDCDSSVEKAKELGAEIKVPPTDVPDVGRFAVIQDPQGAVFSIIKLIHQAGCESV